MTCLFFSEADNKQQRKNIKWKKMALCSLNSFISAEIEKEKAAALLREEEKRQARDQWLEAHRTPFFTTLDTLAQQSLDQLQEKILACDCATFGSQKHYTVKLNVTDADMIKILDEVLSCEQTLTFLLLLDEYNRVNAADSILVFSSICRANPDDNTNYIILYRTK